MRHQLFHYAICIQNLMVQIRCLFHSSLSGPDSTYKMHCQLTVFWYRLFRESKSRSTNVLFVSFWWYKFIVDFIALCQILIPLGSLIQLTVVGLWNRKRTRPPITRNTAANRVVQIHCVCHSSLSGSNDPQSIDCDLTVTPKWNKKSHQMWWFKFIFCLISLYRWS